MKKLFQKNKADAKSDLRKIVISDEKLKEVSGGKQELNGNNDATLQCPYCGCVLTGPLAQIQKWYNDHVQDCDAKQE